MVSEANKVLAAVSKEAAKLVADATKAHAAVTSKTAKSLAAAAHLSHFNLFAPFHPTASDYADMLASSLKKNP